MNKITAHVISICFALIKETRKKIYIYTDKYDSFQAPHYLSLFFLNKIFQEIFRLLCDYGASQCPATSTV